MSLNWKEINAVLEGLSLPGSHVQKIRQPDYSSLVLDLYRKSGRLSLYVHLGQNQTRLHKLSVPVSATVKLQRFAQLLRSKISGGRIIDAHQVGEDRIAKLTVRRASADLLLWIRLWSNAANIILTESDGTIIDAFYRRPKRGEISGGLYHPVDSTQGTREGKRKIYEIRDFPGEGDINERIGRYYFSQAEEQERVVLKNSIERYLNQEETRVLVALEKAQESTESDELIDRHKIIGDILMSNLHRIEKGNRWIDAENYYEENESITIELDPELSPEGNAQAYYQKAKKRRRRAELAGDEIENLRHSLDGIERKRASAASVDLAALRSLNEQLISQQRLRKKNTEAVSVPGLRFERDPFTILVGRTARENDALLRNHVRGNDYWLHARDFPGAYVFIRSIKGKSIPLDVLLDAGTLALYFSKGRAGAHGDLFYTQVKYLRRAKGGKIGLVIPTQEKNLSVQLEDDRLKRLLGTRGRRDQF